MWIISVLARPGTPINRQWPRAKIAINSSSSTACWPTMTLAISPLSFENASFKRSTAAMSSSCCKAVRRVLASLTQLPPI